MARTNKKKPPTVIWLQSFFRKLIIPFIYIIDTLLQTHYSHHLQFTHLSSSAAQGSILSIFYYTTECRWINTK